MRFPYPSYGGEKIAIFNYLKSLRNEEVEIDLISFEDGVKVKEDRIKKLKQIIPNLRSCEIVYLSKTITIVGALYALFKCQPLQVGYFSNFYTKKAVRNFLQKKNYDFVFIHSVRLYPIGLLAINAKKIMYYVDAISMNYLNAVKHLSFPYNLLYNLEGHLLKKYELSLLCKIDTGIFHSHRDVRYLGFNSTKKIKIIPIMGNSSPDFIPVTEKTKKRFLLIANFKSLPNQKSVEYVISLNALLEEYSICIDLVGANLSNNFVQQIKNLKRINYLGKVENLEEQVIDSHGVLCPVNIGAGMQNKILDGISKGRPAVSFSYTSIPFLEHLEYNGFQKDKTGIVNFNNKNELIQKLFKLKNDLNLCNTIGKEGLRAAQVFGFENVKNGFKNIFISN